MKSLFVSLALLLGSLSLFAQSDDAQSDAQAHELLDKMAAQAKSFSTMSASFSVSSEDKQTGAKAVHNGSILVKGERYVVDVMDMVTYSDGKSVSVWQKDNKELDISDVEPDSEGSMTPSKFFGAYKSGYKLRILGNRKVAGSMCTEVDLYPVGKSPIVRIRLSIDTKSNNLRQYMQQSKAGHIMTVTFDDFVVNNPIPDERFVFDAKAHPDVEVVDLR